MMKGTVLGIAAAGLALAASGPAARAGDVYISQLSGTPQVSNNNISPNTPSLLGDVLTLGQHHSDTGIHFGLDWLPPGANGFGGTLTAYGIQFPQAPATGTFSAVIQKQNGNTARADLTSGNASVQYQDGNGNDSTVALTGYGNVAGTVQIGDSNSTSLTMSGNDTTLVSAQIGTGLNLNYSVNQTGMPKTVLISQFGHFSPHH